METIVDALNSILVKFYKWCQQNILRVHAVKTEAMLISCTPFIGPMREIKFGESTIQLKGQSKFLGVIIDNKLSWRTQVDAVRKQYATKIKQLKRLKGLPRKVLEEIYYQAIHCFILYIEIWGTSHVSLTNQLESLYVKAAKLIHDVPSKTSENEVLDMVEWKPLSHIYKRRLERSKNCFTQGRPRSEFGCLTV